MDSKRMTTASILLLLTLVGCSSGSRQAQAQQASGMKEAYAECHRKFHPIKQAIALASCENRSLAPLRSAMRDPDLMDQELAYNLVLAEKVQKGKMSPIEKEAAATQFHSQILAEGERRILARRAAAARDLAAAAAVAAAQPSQSIEIEPTQIPQADYPKLQNNLPQQTRCQTMRIGIMLQTVCN
jgi:hypothetical protein